MSHRGSCHEVEQLLVPYLHGEVSASERAFVQTHLTRCARCQDTLDRLSDLHSRLRVSLQERASDAAPSEQAWEQLQARMASGPPVSSHRHSGERLLNVLSAFPHIFVRQVERAFAEIAPGMARKGAAVPMLLAGLVAALSLVIAPAYLGRSESVSESELTTSAPPVRLAEDIVAQPSAMAPRQHFGLVPDPQPAQQRMVSQDIEWWEVDVSERAQTHTRVGYGRWVIE